MHNVKLKTAAYIIGKSEQYVRIGLQRGFLNIGTAVHLTSEKSYTYHITPYLLGMYVRGVPYEPEDIREIEEKMRQEEQS